MDTHPDRDRPEQAVGQIERQRVHGALRAKLFGAAAEQVRVGRFELRKRLGAGAMGVVYAAYDPQLQREVALKLLNGVALTERESFLHEARALARFSHPNVLQIHEAGLHEGAPYLVSELVEGGTFRAWLEANEHPWRETLALLIAAGRGLLVAHQRGLTHRDIKPENMLIGADGRPRIADFGLALSASPVQGALGAGVIAGTLRYMAPEQRRGERVDPSSDQFSYCVVAFEALYGKLPFQGATDAEILAAIESRELAPVAPTHPAYAALGALRRGMSASPLARYPSMVELLADLEKAARRPRLWPALAAAALLAAGAAGAAALWPARSPGPARPPEEAEEPAVKTARSALAQGRPEDCMATLEGAPPSHASTLLFYQCAGKVGTVEAARRACRHARQENPALPPCEPRQQLTPAGFDPRLSPLHGARICLQGCVEVTHDSREFYLSWASEKGGPTGQERTIRGVFEVSSHCTTCKQQLHPEQMDARLAGAATALLAAADRLVPVATEAEAYYTRGLYKDDQMVTGRRLHTPLLAAYDDVSKAARGFRAEALRVEGEEQRAIQAPLYQPALALLRAGTREPSGIEPAALETALLAFEGALRAAPPADGLRRSSAESIAVAARELLQQRRSGRPFSPRQNEELGTRLGESVIGSPDRLVSAFAGFASHHDLLPPCRHYRSQYREHP